MDQARRIAREALIAHRKSFEARTNRALLWLAVSSIPMVIMFCVLLMMATDQGASPVETPLWLRWLNGASLVLMIVGGIGLIVCLSRSELAMKCPCCRTAIGNLQTLMKVIPTSRCLECEHVIVGANGSLIDREFGAKSSGEKAVTRTYERLESRQALWTTARWAAAGIAWSFISRLILDHWAVPIQAAVGEVTFPFMRVIMGATGIMIFGWGFIRAYRAFDRHTDNCPQCHESISGQIAALTGCCGSCGHVVRPDRVTPVDNSAISGSWSRLGFQCLCQDLSKRIVRHITRTMSIAFPVLFVLLVAMKSVGETLSTVLMFVVFGWTLRAMWQADQMAKKVQCPSCTQPLLRHRWWVIASRRCCGCGERILKD